MKHVNGWNHIILEGFCCRCSSLSKNKYLYDMEGKRIINKHYDPNYRTPRKPSYCKNRITQDCYFKKCPHLGIGEVPEEDHKKIMKKIGDLYD